MKNYEEIKNEEVRKEIIELSSIFEDSFINDSLEFIALLNFHPQKHCDSYNGCDFITGEKLPKRSYFANLYFIIDNCKSKLDVQCKVIEWFSRDCFKTEIGREFVNSKYHQYVLDRVNQYLKTNFNEEDMEIIYTYLGNGINHEKTKMFIQSGFDIGVLEK